MAYGSGLGGSGFSWFGVEGRRSRGLGFLVSGGSIFRSFVRRSQAVSGLSGFLGWAFGRALQGIRACHHDLSLGSWVWGHFLFNP